MPVDSESRTVTPFVENDYTVKVAVLAEDDGVLKPELTVICIVDAALIDEDTLTVII